MKMIKCLVHLFGFIDTEDIVLEDPPARTCSMYNLTVILVHTQSKGNRVTSRRKR